VIIAETFGSRRFPTVVVRARKRSSRTQRTHSARTGNGRTSANAAVAVRVGRGEEDDTRHLRRRCRRRDPAFVDFFFAFSLINRLPHGRRCACVRFFFSSSACVSVFGLPSARVYVWCARTTTTRYGFRKRDIRATAFRRVATGQLLVTVCGPAFAFATTVFVYRLVFASRRARRIGRHRDFISTHSNII